MRAISSRIDLQPAPRTTRAHRPRQRERGERGRLSIARRLPVRRARDQPRSRGRRCARRLRDVPLRRRPRAAGPGGVAGRAARCTSTTSWIARSACSTCAADRRRASPTCRSSRPGSRPRRHREAHARQVLQGKQFFYDARDTRLARDRYMSCATCHNDGGSDGRVWDLTGLGEGLRNTITLRGRAGGPGLPALEQQLRRGAGLRRPDPHARGRHGPDGERRIQRRHAQPAAGRPEGRRQRGPRCARGLRRVAHAFALEPVSQRGRHADRRRQSPASRVFQAKNCGTCHGGTAFTTSGAQQPWTTSARSSRQRQAPRRPADRHRLPTLRDVWATAPYLHDGSAATLGDAVRAHAGVCMTPTRILRTWSPTCPQIGSQEGSARLLGSRTPARDLRRVTSTTRPLREARCCSGSRRSTSLGRFAGRRVSADNFRFAGPALEAPSTGNYRFQTSPMTVPAVGQRHPGHRQLDRSRHDQ